MMMSMAKGGRHAGDARDAGRARRQAGQGQAGSRKKAKAKRGSGNPAKRAAAEKAVAQSVRPRTAPRRTRSALPAGAEEDFDPSSARPARGPLEVPQVAARPPPTSGGCSDPWVAVTVVGAGRVAGHECSEVPRSGAPRRGGPRPVRRRRPGHLRAGRRRPSSSPRAGSSPAWSTRTATSASTRTAPCPRTCRRSRPLADRDAGALLLRDCGSAADTSWIHERDDLPRLIRAGRHIARPRRYIRNYAHEVEPDDLAAYVAQEAQRGDGWVKLVGDWIERDAGDLTPSWTRDSLEAAMKAAHDRGRPGHRPRLRRGRAARPDRRRASTASSTAPGCPPTSSTRWSPTASRWCRPSSSSATSPRTPTPAARSSRPTPTT